VESTGVSSSVLASKRSAWAKQSSAQTESGLHLQVLAPKALSKALSMSISVSCLRG